MSHVTAKKKVFDSIQN